VLLSQSTLEPGFGTRLLPAPALIFRVILFIFLLLLLFLIIVGQRIGLWNLSKVWQFCLISGDRALGG
jgi:hypothetical protein